MWRSLLLIASLFVSSRHETLVKKTACFGSGGYRRICRKPRRSNIFVWYMMASLKCVACTTKANLVSFKEVARGHVPE